LSKSLIPESRVDAAESEFSMTSVGVAELIGSSSAYFTYDTNVQVNDLLTDADVVDFCERQAE
jgi:hypothetical protein